MIFSNKFKKVVKDEDGAVAIITALVLFFVLIGIAAFAIDIGNQTTAKNELQNALDAAALAGAIKLGNTNFDDGSIDDKKGYIKEAAYNAALENKVENINISVSLDDIILGTWDESQDPMFDSSGSPPNAVHVKVNDHSIDSFFASIFNVSQNVSAYSTAVVGPAVAVERLVPIYITEDDSADDDKLIYHKFGSTEPAGNWGLTSFFETGVSDHDEWFENGYPNLVAKGDDINIQTGTGGVQSSKSEVKGLEDEIAVIPVVKNLGKGGHQQSEVTGFRAVRFTTVKVAGAKSEIEVEFIKLSVSGELDLDAEDLGVRTIALVE